MAEHAVEGGVESGWEDDAARWVRRAALVVASGVVLAWGASMVVPMATSPDHPESPYETQAERDRRKARNGASCADCGCTGADCIDCGCEALTTTGCDAADCATCEALDCGGCEAVDCGALDCGSCDCGAVDCGAVDCSGCDVACSVAPGVTRSASVARSGAIARGTAAGAAVGAGEPGGEQGHAGDGKGCRRAPPVGSALALGMPLVLLAIWRRSPGRGNKRKPGDVESQTHDEPEKTPDERLSGE